MPTLHFPPRGDGMPSAFRSSTMVRMPFSPWRAGLEDAPHDLHALRRADDELGMGRLVLARLRTIRVDLDVAIGEDLMMHPVVGMADGVERVPIAVHDEAVITVWRRPPGVEALPASAESGHGWCRRTG